LTAAVSAITGKITDPRDVIKGPLSFTLPEKFVIDDSMILPPSDRPSKVIVERAPILNLPGKRGAEESLRTKVVLKVGDNITTDDIMPQGPRSCFKV